jgi:N-acetylglucosaminyl-diphospho-decaprenol L-rhamnosyltransferase
VKLAVVIVHYNSSADLDRCLESLAACAPRVEHQVVIVDNASSDEGLEEVHRRYPQFTWIFSSENTGYSRGCNLGMSQADAEYYLILNPDIVVQPGALDRLLEFADDHPRAGMVGPQLLNEDGSIQESCRRFYTFKTLLLRRTFFGKIFPNSETVRLHLMQDFDHRSARPVDWVLGGCLLVRRSAMDRTGPMDERFFLYFEDVDWCYRMWQAGFEVQYTPDARFMHRHRRDSAKGALNRSFWMHLGSLISFYEKWGILVWLVKKWRDPLLVFLLWVADMVGLTVAYGAAYGLRGLVGTLAPGLFAEPLFPFAEYRPMLLFSLVLASLTFLMTGRYQPGRQRQNRSATEHLKQVGTLALLLMASTYLGHLEVISRAVLLIFIPLLAVATLLGETGFRALLRRLERGRLSLERTLLVGGPREVGEWLAGSRDLAGSLVGQGVDIAGYLADPETPGSGLPPLGGGAVPWLGTRAEILEVVQRYRISQVVFWERPEATPAGWRDLAGLRRLRIRLRWQIPDVWLLAARTRTELFGDRLSAVQNSQGDTVLLAVVQRLVGLVAGLLLGALGWVPWLVLKLGLVPAGRARIERVRVADLWGNDPELILSLGPGGMPRALAWQWRLAGPLLRGRLAVVGPRASLGGAVEYPRGPEAVVGFWQADPAAPGLTGKWAAGGKGSIAGLVAMMRQLWGDPGGFGILLPDGDPAPEPEENSRLGGEEV